MSDAATIIENKKFDLVKECTQSILDIYGIPVIIKKFETMQFRRDFQEIRNVIYKFKQSFQPDIIYCTSPNALHPDHVIIGEACSSIFLESSVFCMEDARGNHKQLVNKWVILESKDIDVKLKALDCYKSQKHRPYFNSKQLTSMSEMRGLQIGVPLAEGFEIIRDISKSI